MAAQAKQSKVLRIAIFQDGQIVQDKLIKAGDSVTVGESAKNTFVLPKAEHGISEFELFKASASGYVLRFTPQMKGRISSGGAVVALDKLRADQSVTTTQTPSGEVCSLTLTVQDRGKVVLDGVTVLFQFVPPPPAQAVRPMERMDFRAQLFDNEEPALYGLMALFATIGLLIVILIAWSPKPPPVSFDEGAEIVQRIAEVQDDKKDDKDKDEEKEQAETDENAQGPEEEKPAEAPKEKTKAPPKNKVEAAAQKEARKQDLMKSNAVFQMIGTRGLSSASTSTAFEKDVGQGLKGIANSDVGVTTESSGLRKGSGDGNEDVRIDGLQQGEVGSGDVGAVEVKISGTTNVGSGDASEVEGEVASVERTVQAKAGQLNYCYEEQLRSDPDLAGRVEVQWNIAAGRVTAASVTSNTTGNDTLAVCIVRKIKRWRFGKDVSGPVSWPFVFRKK